ncbi:hypothetical protein BN873_260061 [Candidatus Competibacter denitrificans Run_A_D11]|uniref:Uncharacterized protein n=1 Tax=Candidatus Competibacter denitrificans Run_A_D11 TaxID=1400863 RepID=W6M8Z4_9GAMM|nr:hypothetical protein BN873_260061 [Candidatus Competibacter denitrificans Run_A_D11]
MVKLLGILVDGYFLENSAWSYFFCSTYRSNKGSFINKIK